jgi:hypothetical protein
MNTDILADLLRSDLAANVIARLTEKRKNRMLRFLKKW